MKRGRETPLTGDEVGATFENLRGQTSGHASRLPGKRTSHIKPAGRITTRDDFDRADRLRTRLLRGVKCILSASRARFDLRHIKIAGEAVLLPHMREL